MAEPASLVSAWESFYVIVGSSGGALIGLQFVVITLISERRRGAMPADTIGAFGTPTVVHFAGALLISAVMSAPWRSLVVLSIALGICGLAGLAYAAITIRRAHSQTEYKPVGEDWIWYFALPCACYLATAAGAAFLHAHEHVALFIVAGAALGLLLLGIRNAWDSVTHIMVSSSNDDPKTSD